MKKIIKYLKLCLTSLLIIGCFSVYSSSNLYAEDTYDFENEFEYYKTLCTTSPVASENKAACQAFVDYQRNKQKDMQKDIDELKKNINELKKDIINQGALITKYTNKIDQTEAEILATEKAIVRLQGQIEELTLQISARELKITELNDGIKSRMVANQANISLNSYIRFVMGANSFVDLLRRISAVNEITNYDVTKIKEMEEEKKLLIADKETLQEEKANLEEEEEMLKITKANLQALKAEAQKLLDAYYQVEAELAEKMEAAEQDNKELEELLKDLDNILNGYHPSSGWSIFIRKRFKITSPCFFYTSGGFHPAIDAAAETGVPVYAVANGYVVGTKQGCGWGYLGSTCNGGRGNFVDYIVQVGTKIYWVCNYHFTNQSVVKVGQYVYGGETIVGYVGSSGSSTGHHLHIGLIYLGDTTEGYSIAQGAKDYAKKGNKFGLKFNETGTCPNRKNKAPCYVNIQEIFDVWYPKVYNPNN